MPKTNSKSGKGKAKGKTKASKGKTSGEAKASEGNANATDYKAVQCKPSKSAETPTYTRHMRCRKLDEDECRVDPACLWLKQQKKCSAIRNIDCVPPCDTPTAPDIGRMNDRIDYLTGATFLDEDETAELDLLMAYRAAINDNMQALDSDAKRILHIDREIDSLCASGKNRKRLAELQKDRAQLAQSFASKAGHLGLAVGKGVFQFLMAHLVASYGSAIVSLIPTPDWLKLESPVSIGWIERWKSKLPERWRNYWWVG